MTGSDIRKTFLKFFISKDHTLVPSSSLVPDDPSVLLTTAGMQQFKPYYDELDPTRTLHPSLGRPVGRNACSAQKSFRTSDIDEVGDASHLTFFEMLGNFSFGGYFKKEAIGYAFEFITRSMGLTISYVTVFKGSDQVPRDDESRRIWNSLGVSDVREEGMDDVFWGPTGSSGPCGPTTEVYCENAEGAHVEVWNIVFNEFLSLGSREELNAGRAKLKKLAHPGVDTGMGLERLAMIAQGKRDVFETDLFTGPFGEVLAHRNTQSARIVADHLRAALFLLSDGITPSNKDRGYVLRRIIRRLIVHAGKLGYTHGALAERFFPAMLAEYRGAYPDLAERIGAIRSEYDAEAARFATTLSEGLTAARSVAIGTDIAGTFRIYQSFGIPPDVLRDIAREQGNDFNGAAFDAEFRKHQEVSKAGATGKFGGHGLILSGELKASNEDEVRRVTRLHTATHMLHQALRTVLGDHVAQQGSDITPERLRFDFTHPKKLTADEIAAVERLVNDEVRRDHAVTVAEMPFAQAKRAGALAFFREKYPDTVKVYAVGDFSKEVCGGPHVPHTGEIGEVKIVKEEAVSAGTRRIRAVVIP